MHASCIESTALNSYIGVVDTTFSDAHYEGMACMNMSVNRCA